MTDSTTQRSIEYRLTNPGYTIYHRAALGGLAATVQAWDEGKAKDKPVGITAELDADRVRLSWQGITDQEALRSILDASFKLTNPDKPHGGKLIDLPGHEIKSDDGLRLAIHNGLVGTFLQFHTNRPGEAVARRIELKNADEDVGSIFTYKAIDSYSHQDADHKLKLFDKEGRFVKTAMIPQWVIPGAMTGSRSLEASSEETVLLLFLMVGCAVFLLRPRQRKDRAQYCIVVPDVVDLNAFADELRHVAGMGREAQNKQFKNTYLNRVVGGAEEAAFNFLIDMEAGRVAKKRHGIAGCVAIAMGKVAWDANQINRSVIVKIGGKYDEIEVFKAAKRELSGSRAKPGKNGESYAFTISPIPELVAANLAAGRHWCAHFSQLVSDKKDFHQMFSAETEKGLVMMKEAIKDADDQAIIKVFHEAWWRRMGAIGALDSQGKLVFSIKVESEKEKMRNGILRAKTAEVLAAWFLRFCADATKKGAPLDSLRDSEIARRVREFIFNPRNFERFQNLCLFSLVSYAGKHADTSDGNTEGDE